MREEDVLLPAYRDNAALIWRGVKLDEILLYRGGDESGNRTSGPAHDFPCCIPVGPHTPRAASVAYAFKLRKEMRVAVCLFGDGATSKGDVWEAINGVQKLPVVFVVVNNQWAISVPLRRRPRPQRRRTPATITGRVSQRHRRIRVYANDQFRRCWSRELQRHGAQPLLRLPLAVQVVRISVLSLRNCAKLFPFAIFRLPLEWSSARRKNPIEATERLFASATAHGQA